ncbi:MAG: SMEK domain-containing protein [Shewanella oncorhynchi]
MNKEISLKEIIYWLSHLSTSAKLGGKIHFFDLNIVAEDFYANLLNIVYDWNLKNLNHTDLNAVAVDLGDVRRKIAVQVTSNRSKSKIQKTLDNFDKYSMPKNFDTLKVVIIGSRTGDYPSLNVPSGMKFKGAEDVIDENTLIKKISSLPTQKVKDILQLMTAEIRPKADVEASSQHDDARVLKEYRSYFDRPALKDKWQAEGDYLSFVNALSDLISLMNTGIVKHKSITKSRFEISSDSLKQDLSVIAEQLRIVRQLFNSFVRSGDIDLANNYSNFKVSEKSDAFDNLRDSIIVDLNRLLKDNGITPIS